MIDDEIDKKIRQLQARKITKTEGSYSYSKTINDQLKKAFNMKK